MLLVTTKLLLSARGCTAMVGRDIPLRFVWTSIVTPSYGVHTRVPAVLPENDRCGGDHHDSDHEW
jgi:hypothetical protein